ncbi:ANTAR domain-containing response regulator [Pseudoroseomonas cervicalis]|uniref:ANTAR domain-containing response regulator n=1 Tax=Teichococcus cervicalis TaxID=204525 RepID=UPI0027839582|nr:ANTAR domain-containing protein [Pseudoroseomonas cervicalis]MDQ1081668.1 AmiR/NasT family two-component response regulator [Pseudoroseomonas cervicalis]
MAEPALLQNFRGLRALLLSPAPEPGEATRMLEPSLQRLGVELTRCAEAAALPPAQPQRDLLILDGDDDLATLLAPLPASWLASLPILGLVGVEAPGRLRGLMQAGATAFLRKPVHGASVYAALFMGINAHRARQHSAALLAAHERRRRGRPALIRATLRVMQLHGLDDDAAYDLLRRAAMRARMSIEEYSEAWLARQAPAATAPQAPNTTQRIA